MQVHEDVPSRPLLGSVPRKTSQVDGAHPLATDTGISTRIGRSDRGRHGFVAFGVGAFVVALLATVAFRGWIPHDEGTLGQAATRILAGEWPHVDFLDVYPGLQGVLHALAFELLGPSIATLRIVWLGVVGVSAAAAFSLLRERLDTWTAALGAVGLSVLAFVLYPASMPTWWNASLALVSLALAWRGWKTQHKALVLGAGLVIGASVLIKSTGGLVVGVPTFVWLVTMDPRSSRRWRLVAIGAAGLLFVAILLPALSMGRFLFAGLPALIGVLALVGNERELPDSSRARLWPIYGVGLVALPLAVTVIYAISGHLPELVEGWITAPALRYGGAEHDIPVSLPLIAIVVGFVLVARFISGWDSRPLVTTVVISGFLLAVAWAAWPNLYLVVVGGAVCIAPILGVVILRRTRLSAIDPLIVLVVSAALCFTMTMVPFWNGFYVAYTLPLVLTALLLAGGRAVAPMAATVVAVLASLFLFHSLNGTLVGATAVAEPVEFVSLDLPRTGIDVPYRDLYYADLIRTVADVSRGDVIYAGPDAPEIAFLADVPVATDSFYEVLDPDWSYETPALLAETGLPVVINHSPSFSDRIPKADLERIYAANQESESFEEFEVTWANDRD